jgi:phosphate:Na+ symporter
MKLIVTTIVTMIANFIGGLGIFLPGMKYMSDGMQEFTGNKLKKFISLATDNRFIACGIGTAIMSIIQSMEWGEKVFFILLNAYRRIKDHCLNIAEALAGEK